MTVNRRVLVDHYGPPLRLNIVEGQDGGTLVVEGKIGHVDKPTANNRVYPRSVMEREINRLQPRIAQGSVIGAVDHPGDGKSRIREGGCIVRGLSITEDGTINGRFEVVEEADAGRNLAAFLRRGAAIGMSSRGMGSTSTGPQGWDMVGEDFKLNTWDFVADPACHDAYPGIISEDVDGKPTGKIVVDPKEVTEGALRKHFPDAVRAIEQHAMRVASETAIEDTDDRIETEIQTKTEEVYKKAIEELREDFAAKLVRALAEMRKSVEEEVRSDFASDPETAGAKLALKKIAEMTHPYAPTADEKKVLDEKDTKIDELIKAVDEQETETKGVTDRITHVEEKARELAFRLFVEQQIAGRSDHERVRDLIGDITECGSVEELKTRVESALTSIEEAQMTAQTEARAEAGAQVQLAEERATEAEASLVQITAREKRYRAEVSKRFETLESQLTSVIENKDEEIASARERIEEQADMLERAVTAGTRAQLLAYASDRTIGHPERDAIMESVRSNEVASKEEIDELASSSEVRAQESGGPMENVRRAMSSGREHVTEDERREFEASENQGFVGGDEASRDLEYLGTSLTEQQQMAGRTRRI